jgi:hypothetical protein
MADGAKIVVKLVDQRNSRGDIQPGDLFVRDPVEVLDERTKAVSMRRDDHAFPGADCGRDVALPVRQEPCHGVPEAFRQGELPAAETGIPGIPRRRGG